MESFRRQNITMKLGIELVNLNKTVGQQEMIIDDLTLKAAMYKANFFGKYELGEKLQSQINENHDNCIGEWDGFCFCSLRANAVYRTLYEMLQDGLITKEEYRFCEV